MDELLILKTVTIGVAESTGGFRAVFRRADGLMPPALDRCAHGLSVRPMLDEFLMYVPDPPPPAGAAAAAH